MLSRLLFITILSMFLTACTTTPLLRGIIDSGPGPVKETPPSEFTAWLPYWDWANALSSTEQTAKLNTISPFTYILTPEGSITAKQTIPETLLSKYLVIPTISHELDAKRVTDILDDQEVTTTHLNKILEIAAPYPGIELDYENLPATYRNTYSQFIEQLATKLHAQNKKLVLALHAKTNDVISRSGIGSLDYARLCQAADLCRIMAYDYRYTGSDPGPVAPLYWIKEVISYTQTIVPNEKLVLGLPLYGYEWTEPKKGISRTQTQINKIISQPDTTTFYDEKAQSPYLRYDTTTELWYDNAKSLQAKIEYARSKGIYQFAFWKLGQDEGILNAL